MLGLLQKDPRERCDWPALASHPFIAHVEGQLEIAARQAKAKEKEAAERRVNREGVAEVVQREKVVTESEEELEPAHSHLQANSETGIIGGKPLGHDVRTPPPQQHNAPEDKVRPG